MEILKVIKKKQVSSSEKANSTASSQSKQESSKPSNQVTEKSPLDKPEKYYYQGIGWLLATVEETEEGYFSITLLDGNSFDYKAPPRLSNTLREHIINSPEEPLWLLCYPNYNIESKVLSFRGVTCKKEQPSQVESGVFTLRGVWHFIKFNRNPVFSIYRNTLKFPKDRVKNNHLPLTGLDETPFNKQKDAPEEKKFYQIQARLNSSEGCFEWVRN